MNLCAAVVTMLNTTQVSGMIKEIIVGVVSVFLVTGVAYLAAAAVSEVLEKLNND